MNVIAIIPDELDIIGVMGNYVYIQSLMSNTEKNDDNTEDVIIRIKRTKLEKFFSKYLGLLNRHTLSTGTISMPEVFTRMCFVGTDIEIIGKVDMEDEVKVGKKVTMVSKAVPIVKAHSWVFEKGNQ